MVFLRECCKGMLANRTRRNIATIIVVLGKDNLQYNTNVYLYINKDIGIYIYIYVCRDTSLYSKYVSWYYIDSIKLFVRFRLQIYILEQTRSHINNCG